MLASEVIAVAGERRRGGTRPDDGRKSPSPATRRTRAWENTLARLRDQPLVSSSHATRSKLSQHIGKVSDTDMLTLARALVVFLGLA